jgi:dehydrogenase/reductase SDR family protein 1
MTKPLENTVALVTGGSRGVGKGIAIGLGEAGATVYLTGRSEKRHQAAGEVTEAGGKGIPVECDHRIDGESRKVFDLIGNREGRLDILVNNVWGGYERMLSNQGEYIWENPFWEQPLEYWDLMFASGVRAHYVNSRHAARMMVKQKCGLIVNISFWAAQKFIGNAGYGVSKAATDKLTKDTAHNLKSHNVAVVSLYPGLVRTERVMEAAEFLDLSNSESPRFLGRVVSKLASDPRLMDLSGTIQVAAQLAIKYNVQDVDGKQPKPLTIEDV